MELYEQLRLSESVRKGIISTVVCGLVSAVAAFFLFLYLLNRVLGMVHNAVPLIPVTYFYLSLIFWDILAALGFVVNVRWVALQRIETGKFCTSQAIIQQLSSTGTSLSIVAISVCILHDHIFYPGRDLNRFIGPIGLFIIFVVQAIDLAVPNARFGYLSYYGLAGYWCWISEAYHLQRVLTEYFFFWLAAGVFFVTAAYFTLTRYGIRPRVGFLWIGFIRGNQLFRFAPICFDTNKNRHPMLGVSIRYDTNFGVMELFAIQYFDNYYQALAIETTENLHPNANADALDIDDEDSISIHALQELDRGHPGVAILDDATISDAHYGRTSDPEVDWEPERLYIAPNEPVYQRQIHIRPELVPNRLDRTYPESTRSSISSEGSHGESPLKLLLFPFAYVFVIGPLSILRFIKFRHDVSAGWVLFGACCFAIQGLLDVGLWLYVRPTFGINYGVDPLVRLGP